MVVERRVEVAGKRCCYPFFGFTICISRDIPRLCSREISKLDYFGENLHWN